MSARWIKSSFSNGDDQSVRVATGSGLAEGRVFMRLIRLDGVTSFPRAEWDAFVKGVKAGEFDDV